MSHQGKFWRRLYEVGGSIESGYPVRIPRFERLRRYAQRRPGPGSALQGLLFAVLTFPVSLAFVLLSGLGLWVAVVWSAVNAVVFGGFMFGYNRYVSRHGEPWASPEPTAHR